MTLTPGVTLGPYRVMEVLGAGGVGEVYRAIDTRLDRIVAIKVLQQHHAADPVRQERFEREARAISALNHAHISALYDVGHLDHAEASGGGVDFLVMEYCEGETLHERLARKPMRVSEALRHAIAIADALALAHRHGITHRDLKPGNVILTAAGAKLLDFGVAKWRASRPAAVEGLSTAGGEDESLTVDGALIGTPSYMAPEQLEGKDVDARTDIFALGAVLYEMLTGRRAFQGSSRASVIAAILERDPEPMGTMEQPVPPALKRVVRKCLAKDPDQRWQTAQDVADELRWIAETDTQVPFGTRQNIVRRAIKPSVALLIIGAAITSLFLFAPEWRRTSAADARSIRFTIGAPDDMRFSTAGATMALSPDGHALVFAAVGGDGQALLWLRLLDATVARPLEGTAGATAPFWSPDNRHVAFFADGALKKLDLASAQVKALCKAERAFGGTWNRDGVILFSQGRGLFRVSAAGGSGAAVTNIDGAAPLTYHTWPQFLPDGRHFVYRVFTPDGQGTGIYLGMLDDGSRHIRLVDADSNAAFAAGHLLYGRHGTLFAQPFDDRRGRLTGDPIPVADHIMYNPVSGRVHFTVSDTGVLSFRTEAPTELVWVDRSGSALTTIEPVGIYRDPAVSLTGRIAVARVDAGTGTEDIWVFDPGQRTPIRLTSDPARDIEPVWSADGRQIIFSSNRSGSWRIYRMSADGAQTSELSLQSSSVSEATHWSRDGRFLVLQHQTHPTMGDVWMWPTSGERQPFPLLKSTANERDGQLSPDNRWIAYSLSDNRMTSNFDVYVSPFPAVDRKWRVSQGGGGEPTWRADGKELFYLAPDGSLMAAAVHAEREFTVEPGRVLFKTASAGRSTGVTGHNRYDIAADGQRFLLMQPARSADSPPITVVVKWTSSLAPH